MKYLKSILFLILSAFLIAAASEPDRTANVGGPSAPADAANVVSTRKLAFTRRFYLFQSVFQSVHTANVDGSGQVSVGAEPPVWTIEPDWSPDGTKIVHVWGPIDIWVMNADGSNRISLTNTVSVNERNPVWSVTGKIAYEREERIWTMNSDGTNQMPLAGIVQPVPTSPAWSPDGTRLAFISGNEIWVINADGTNERRVTNNDSADTSPTWSGDGTRIAFSKGTSGIAVIDLAGTNEILISNGNDSEPSWSHDNGKIAFVRRSFPVSGIYVMDGNGANQLRVIADYQVNRGYDNFSPAWQPVARSRRTQFDFDGDGRADIGVVRPSNFDWFILRSTGGQTQQNFGLPEDVLAPADYDGDGKTDLGVFRPSTGTFWKTSSLSGGFSPTQWGTAGDIPRPSDFDGDGKADFIVYRPSNGVWYRLKSDGSQVSIVQFGQSGDQPLTGDFDGDGKSDPAVFRPSNGTWWYLSSANGGGLGAPWGTTGDIPAAADFDGDGRTEFAVFRPSNGYWYIYNLATAGVTITQFGLSGDRPVAADYDGDGKTDIAVFRPSTGVWYVLQSTGGFFAAQFGTGTDLAIPNAFVP